VYTSRILVVDLLTVESTHSADLDACAVCCDCTGKASASIFTRVSAACLFVRSHLLSSPVEYKRDPRFACARTFESFSRSLVFAVALITAPAGAGSRHLRAAGGVAALLSVAGRWSSRLRRLLFGSGFGIRVSYGDHSAGARFRGSKEGHGFIA